MFALIVYFYQKEYTVYTLKQSSKHNQMYEILSLIFFV